MEEEEEEEEDLEVDREDRDEQKEELDVWGNVNESKWPTATLARPNDRHEQFQNIRTAGS